MIKKVNKKASAAVVIVVVILVIIVLFWIGKSLMKECRKDTDCSSGYYCGSDFKCHDLKMVTIYKQNLLMPSLIIAVALVAGAVILRKKKEKTATENQQPENPYYK